MHKIFKNAAHQVFFEENGYIKLPWLTIEEVQILRERYYHLNMAKVDGFFATYGIKDVNTRRVAWEAISEIFIPKIEHYFVDMEGIMASFITKTKGDVTKEYISSHQDWSFVDEVQGFTSLNLWCPLEATSFENGNLGFVPQSHKLRRYPRQAEDCVNPYLAHYHLLKPYERYMPTQLGEALVFNNAIFHFSSANTTDSDRLVAGMMITEKDAPLTLYYQNKLNPLLLDRYRPDVKYFLEVPFGERPTLFEGSFVKPIIEAPEKEIMAVYPDAVNFQSRMVTKEQTNNQSNVVEKGLLKKLFQLLGL